MAEFWHDLEQRADDLRATRRAGNAYADTPLMRALQRAERAELQLDWNVSRANSAEALADELAEALQLKAPCRWHGDQEKKALARWQQAKNQDG